MFNIRKINTSDYPALNQLFKEMAIFEKVPERMLNSVEQMHQEKAFIHGYIAETQGGEIAGYVTHFFAYYTWVGKSLYMDDLYVRESFRGQGIGSQLIKKVIEFAEKENCKRLRWQVSEWNQSAIKFYESLGAKIESTESNCDLYFPSL